MASSAPVVATPEPSGPVATPSPTVFASATLSPNAVETCTTSCLYTGTASLYTAYYYDYRCQGRDDNELAGCNLAAFDSSLENCRVCVINRDEFEAEGGGGMCVCVSMELLYRVLGVCGVDGGVVENVVVSIRDGRTNSG